MPFPHVAPSCCGSSVLTVIVGRPRPELCYPTASSHGSPRATGPAGVRRPCQGPRTRHSWPSRQHGPRQNHVVPSSKPHWGRRRPGGAAHTVGAGRRGPHSGTGAFPCRRVVSRAPTTPPPTVLGLSLRLSGHMFEVCPCLSRPPFPQRRLTRPVFAKWPWAVDRARVPASGPLWLPTARPQHEGLCLEDSQ